MGEMDGERCRCAGCLRGRYAGRKQPDGGHVYGGFGGYIAWAEETGYTFAQLVHSPLLVLRMCYNTLMWQGEKLYSGMLGESLGNMDAVLNTPYVLILGLTAILLMLAFRKPGERLVMTMANRAWIWLLCFLCLGA